MAEIEKSMLSKELDDADIIRLLLDYEADVDYHTRLVSSDILFKMLLDF